MRWPRNLIVALLLALIPGAPWPLAAEEEAQAQTGAAEEPAHTEEDVLLVEGEEPYLPARSSVAAKMPVPLMATPASVGVVTRPALEEQGAEVLTDALRNVSGVNVQSQSGVTDFFLIRGVDSLTGGLVLTDGAAEPEATYYHTYNLERVEVLKGPGAFLYGGNPLSGTVNLVRKQPAAGNSARVAASAGSFETYRTSVDVNTASPSGRLGFRVNALWQESDGYRDDKESRARAVNPVLAWNPGPASTLTFNLELAESDYSPDAGLPVLGDGLPGVPRTTAYESPFDVSEQDVARLRVDYQTRLGSAVTLRTKTYFTELEWRSDGTLLNGVLPDFATGRFFVLRSLLLLDDDQEFLGHQTEALLTVQSGSVSHQILAGLELARLVDRFTLDVALLPPVDLARPVEPPQGPPFVIPGLGTAADTESEIIAPYILDRISFSKKVELFVGARLDAIDFSDQLSGAAESHTELSPMLGITYSPSTTLSLYANAGEAFAPPSTLVVGDREPEVSRQVEAGVKKRFLAGKAQASLALFQLDRENIPIPDASGITRRQGDQRSRGIELEVAAALGRGLHGSLAYAYTDAELTRFAEIALISFFPPTFGPVDRSGNRPPFAPEHILNLWLSKRFKSGFGIAGGGRWVDRQAIAPDNVFTIGEALTFDAALYYDLGRWQLNLHVKNLTDEDYETRGFGAFSVIPADPAAVYGGVEYRF